MIFNIVRVFFADDHPISFELSLDQLLYSGNSIIVVSFFPFSTFSFFFCNRFSFHFAMSTFISYLSSLLSRLLFLHEKERRRGKKARSPFKELVFKLV